MNKNNVFADIWKEAVMSSLRYYISICWEGLSKTTKNIRRPRNFPPGMWTGYVWNDTKLDLRETAWKGCIWLRTGTDGGLLCIL